MQTIYNSHYNTNKGSSRSQNNKIKESKVKIMIKIIMKREIYLIITLQEIIEKDNHTKKVREIIQIMIENIHKEIDLIENMMIEKKEIPIKIIMIKEKERIIGEIKIININAKIDHIMNIKRKEETNMNKGKI